MAGNAKPPNMGIFGMTNDAAAKPPERRMGPAPANIPNNNRPGDNGRDNKGAERFGMEAPTVGRNPIIPRGMKGSGDRDAPMETPRSVDTEASVPYTMPGSATRR
jgi:hypothetical protein